MLPELVDTPEALEALGALAARSRVIALDTESNSLHAWREKVCVVQIELDGRVFLVDTVVLRDLSPLRAAFEDPRILKLLHGADYDVVCLKRDFGFGPRPIFDTMLAAQMLGYEAFGLAAVAERLVGVKLDKSLTKHDWGARPLQAEVIPYLVHDVLHLTRIAALLQGEVATAELQEELELECQRVERLDWSGDDRSDPEAWRKMKGLRDLDTALHGVLRELFQWREQRAEAMDRPPFKILGNAVLLEISQRRPQARRELFGITGLPPRLLERHAHAILGCVQRGLEQPAQALPRPVRRAPFDRLRSALDENLRNWRREVMQASGRNSLVVLPNHVLQRIVADLPQDLEALALIEGLGTRRHERHGAQILAVVHDTRRQEEGSL
ncbi:MAG: ribonuclease D [Planctomycetes bacterium]|nr:ribonuclease D [Planctomycetota bacterium]